MSLSYDFLKMIIKQHFHINLLLYYKISNLEQIMVLILLKYNIKNRYIMFWSNICPKTWYICLILPNVQIVKCIYDCENVFACFTLASLCLWKSYGSFYVYMWMIIIKCCVIKQISCHAGLFVKNTSLFAKMSFALWLRKFYRLLTGILLLAVQNTMASYNQCCRVSCFSISQNQHTKSRAIYIYYKK